MPLARREQLKGTHHVTVASKTSPALTSCVSKLQLHDYSLNAGVGAGALYILITCQEEMKRLNKTVQETEELVQELKEQLQQHHEDSGSWHASHIAEGRRCSNQSPHADMDFNLDECLEERVRATREMGKDQMAALAAELEAELELMELNIKAEEIFPSETLMHDSGEVSSKGVSNSHYSNTSSHGMLEVSDVGRTSAQLETSQMGYGVSAIELDQRLREVLEAQQEKRILELEQLLKETKAKLLAKECEILCWKNHVNSLADLLQSPSSKPQVTKSAVELLHAFHDPPLSTQVNYVDSSKVGGNFDHQGTHIDIPEFVIMKDIDTHTAAHSETGSPPVNVDGGDSSSGSELSKPHHRTGELDGDRGYVYDDDVPSSRSGLGISRFHHLTETSASPPNIVRSKEEQDRDSDVKHIVNYVMPKPILLDKYHDDSDGEAIEALERSLKSKNKSIQLVTKGLKKEAHDRSAEMTSPVLDKIRHYEALGGRAREKRI